MEESEKYHNIVYAYTNMDKLLVSWNGYYFTTGADIQYKSYQILLEKTYKKKLENIKADILVNITTALQEKFECIVGELLVRRPQMQKPFLKPPLVEEKSDSLLMQSLVGDLKKFFTTVEEHNKGHKLILDSIEKLEGIVKAKEEKRNDKKSHLNLYFHWERETIGEIKLDILPGSRNHLNVHIPNEFVYQLMDMMKDRFAKIVVNELQVYEEKTTPRWKKLWRKYFPKKK